MSEFTAIRAVTETLSTLLEEHITNSTDLQLAGVAIELNSPKEMRATPPKSGVSLWLYRVTRNGDTLNGPPLRVGPDEELPRPLPLDLHYLVTPMTGNEEDEQMLLGRVLQTLNDHTVIRGTDLQGDLAGEDTQLRVNLEQLTLEELTRVWSALEEPYQLSVSYQIQVVNVSTAHEPVRTAPVLVEETEYDQILEVLA
jgi:Pvc16 N-terminal domain